MVAPYFYRAVPQRSDTPVRMRDQRSLPQRRPAVSSCRSRLRRLPGLAGHSLAGRRPATDGTAADGAAPGRGSSRLAPAAGLRVPFLAAELRCRLGAYRVFVPSRVTAVTAFRSQPRRARPGETRYGGRRRTVTGTRHVEDSIRSGRTGPRRIAVGFSAFIARDLGATLASSHPEDQGLPPPHDLSAACAEVPAALGPAPPRQHCLG
jgi:hypothetical protein